MAGAGSLQQPQRLSRPASLSWQPTGAPETDGTGRAVKAGKRRRTHRHQNCVSVSIATCRRRRQQLGAPGVIKCREKRAEWGWSRRRARLKRGTKVRRGTKLTIPALIQNVTQQRTNTRRCSIPVGAPVVSHRVRQRGRGVGGGGIGWCSLIW